jgi:ornithine cyclodeaminase/alanine dehydrogenase-like protein (mu-crystallin family)
MNASPLYEELKKDYLECMTTEEDRKRFCPFKTCMGLSGKDGAVTERFTVMPSMDRTGNFGAKTIYVNDETGEYREQFVLNGKAFNYSHLTAIRCALVARLCVDMLGIKTSNVGFVGNGRVNLEIRKELSPDRVVIHGAKGREGKNAHLFATCIVDKDFSLLNKCDVVFVCTNSFKAEDLISTKELHPDYLIVLDCGYALDESFRQDYPLYSDYPEQLRNQYDEEFPFDKRKDYVYKPLSCAVLDNPPRACVYVHGCGICDLSVAKQVYR